MKNIILLFIIFPILFCCTSQNNWEPKKNNEINYFTDGKLTIAYKIYNENLPGEPILFFYGFGGSIPMMDAIGYNFNKNKILVVDYPGHCYSPKLDTNFDLDTFCNTVNKLERKLNNGKTNLVGYSLGGIVALNYYSKYKDQIKKIVLWNSVAYFNSNIERKIYFNIVKMVMNTNYKFGVLNIAIPILRDKYFTDKNYEDAKKIAMYNDPASVIKFFDTIINYNAESILKEINCPVLVIGSNIDILAKPEFVKKTAKSINGSKLILFYDSGHLNLVSRSRLLAGIIENFL